MLEQTIWLSPKATAFTAVCETCSVEHGYHAAHVEGRLLLDRAHGSVVCARGHVVRLERADRDPIGVLSNVA